MAQKRHLNKYGPDSKMPCEICSATCNERAKHFEEQGKKKYTIGNIFLEIKSYFKVFISIKY